MKNRRTWIAGVTATAILAASLAACKQERKEQEMGQTLPVMVVSSRPVEFQETYSAAIRGRQDVDIIPQVSGRITPPVRERGRTGKDRAGAGRHRPGALSGSLAHGAG